MVKTFSIYVDESGNSGKNLFDDNLYFYQGALFCSANCDELFGEFVRDCCDKFQVDRLHAHKIGIEGVEALVLDAVGMMDLCDWSFNLFSIEKSYITTCKFVDVFFDSGLNHEVPWVLYNHEYYKHSLCLMCDSVLRSHGGALFWDGFLKADKVKIIQSIEFVKADLSECEIWPPEYKLLVQRALDYVIRNFDKFIPNKVKRYEYQIHTPNMIAFSKLFEDAENFSAKYNASPELLLYDKQGEFGKTMKKWFDEYSAYTIDKYKGVLKGLSAVKKQIGKFEVASGVQNPSLQIVDSLLWLYQRREKRNKQFAALEEKIVKYEISNFNSRVLKKAWEYGHKKGTCRIPYFV
ncbi:DUF3800 domain-containing protein [uncultured Pseudodesulfovibrio sp.]|uniref:DUF3800 domain-containing protein n=1 Tax=uncultured Pseudodesulfovibrio sp. TaxID=2035858 RepID=UPI0029C60ABD|nr:DUF3800 domain-containing protein [uncultured Pseudodesulfovibrio sp.]